MPTDRNPYPPRIAAARQNLELIEAGLAELALAADRAPDDQDLKDRLAQVKRERTAAAEAVENLLLASQAAAKEVDVVEAQKRREEIAVLRKKHEAACKDAERACAALVSHLEAIAPLWSQALETLHTAHGLALDAAKLQGPAARKRLFGHGQALDGHAALANAVGSAMAKTGLGSTGPSLSPYVAVVPPMQPFTAADLERNLRATFARQREATEEA